MLHKILSIDGSRDYKVAFMCIAKLLCSMVVLSANFVPKELILKNFAPFAFVSADSCGSDSDVTMPIKLLAKDFPSLENLKLTRFL